MATIKYTKKRKVHRLFKFSVTLLVFAVVVTVLTSVFIRGEAVAVQVEIQRTQARLRNLSIENEALAVEIEELTTYQRVISIANEAGLDRNLANHVAIDGN